MKRALILLLLLVVAAAVAWTSVVIVPDGSAAWAGGRVLGPGLHLKAPWASVQRYPDGARTVEVQRPVITAEGTREEVTVEVRFSWQPEALVQRPVAPDGFAGAVDDALAAVDGRIPSAELGRSLDEELPRLLATLPVTVNGVSVSYPGMAFEELAAAAEPTGARVVFVGLDGLDWGLLDRLIDAGRAPTFAALKARGAWGDMVSHQPVLSPLIWTTMATGRQPDDHGILDFVVEDPETGDDVPITNQFRKVHAFWNILSYVGIDVNVVNWWASYPAEPVQGVMVAERLFYQLFGITPPRDDPANVYPPEILSDVLPRLIDVEAVDLDEVQRFADIDEARWQEAMDAAETADNPFDDRVNHLRKIIAVTEGVFQVGRWILQEHPADLTALYVEGTDTIGHRFAHYLPPKLGWVDPVEYQRFRRTMESFYVEVDRQLGELMQVAPEDTTWVIAADHGFFTGRARPGVDPSDFTVGAAQWHRMTGVFIAAGPMIEPGRLEACDIYDVARTLLWLVGAPVADTLVGRELTEMVDPGWRAEHPPVRVPTYDDLPHTWKAEGVRTVLDEARVKELEALGYLSAGQSAAEAAGGGAPAGDDRPETTSAGGLEGKFTELYNLGNMAKQQGDWAEAERYYLEAMEVRPDFAFGMLNLAQVYSATGQPDEALKWLTRVLQNGSPSLPDTVVVLFAQAAKEAGREDRILGALALVEERWGDTAAFHAARGMGLLAERRVQEAEVAFRRALEIDPTDATATEQMLVLASSGRAIDIDGLLEAHFRAVRGDLKKLNRFAVLCLRQGRLAQAEVALRELLESDPSNAGVLSNLAAALSGQGNRQEAVEVLGRAAASRPQDPNLAFNHGAALASLGRHAEALAEIERAVGLGLDGPRVVEARAKILVRLGRVDDAKRVLTEGVERFPGQPQLQELLAILER